MSSKTKTFDASSLDSEGITTTLTTLSQQYAGASAMLYDVLWHGAIRLSLVPDKQDVKTWALSVVGNDAHPTFKNSCNLLSPVIGREMHDAGFQTVMQSGKLMHKYGIAKCAKLSTLWGRISDDCRAAFAKDVPYALLENTVPDMEEECKRIAETYPRAKTTTGEGATTRKALESKLDAKIDAKNAVMTKIRALETTAANLQAEIEELQAKIKALPAKRHGGKEPVGRLDVARGHLESISKKDAEMLKAWADNPDVQNKMIDRLVSQGKAKLIIA